MRELRGSDGGAAQVLVIFPASYLILSHLLRFISCAAVQCYHSSADIIQAEARARVLGEVGNPALAGVPCSALKLHAASPRPQPAVSVYVDDYIGSCLGINTANEVVEIAALVFELVGAS
mmetsp:Transcript_32029/g.75488  ORF Transcript_32029/g.75488 Transcript_32029/m.75488 type:complete len:120 (-) Transcript_32029:136-495(-)